MRFIDTPQHRRAFLRLGLTFTGGVLLSACGGGGGSTAESDAVVVVPGPATPAAAAPVVVDGGVHALNLALTLAYVGAQYHGIAARGAGLPTTLTGGVGRTGAATGARAANFADAQVAAHAAELADDKLAHVAALRAQLGALAAAQPAIDLSATGAFARAGQQAGFASGAAAFDPYARDGDFLAGAFLIENAVAAAYRTLLAQTAEEPAATLIRAHLADAIYHGGLIRTLIDGRAADDPVVERAMTAATQALVALDGSGVVAADAGEITANLPDAEGRPIPFTRDAAQVLRTLTLSTTEVGGFLPMGANGLPA